jgi:hypothetical protein
MNPLSGVLGEAWQMYKAHATHLLVIAFVIYLAAAVITALFTLGGTTLGAVLGSLVGIVAEFLLQATLIKAVQDVRDGRVDMSIGETVRAATPYLGAVAGASILAGIAIAIGLILLIVPGLILITIWAVIVPVIVLEQSGALASFGRSQQLVRGRGWHVFWTLVLMWLILLAVYLVLGLIFYALPPVLGRGLSSVISGTIVAPFVALVVTLVYYRLSATSQVPAAPGENYGGYGQTPLQRDPDYAGRPADDLSPAGRPALTGPRRPRRAGGEGHRAERPAGHAAGHARTAAAAQCCSRCGTRSMARSSGKNSRAPSTVTTRVVPGMVSRSQ